MSPKLVKFRWFLTEIEVLPKRRDLDWNLEEFQILLCFVSLVVSSVSTKICDVANLLLRA